LEDSDPSTTLPAYGTDGSFFIGKSYWTSESFNGTMDDIMIFNRSLSQEQIQALYNNRTDLIVSNETSPGDKWSACITPNDGYEDGTRACSDNLTIIGGNIPPQMSIL